MSQIKHTPEECYETYQNPEACKELIEHLLDSGMMPKILEACVEWLADENNNLPIAPEEGTHAQVHLCRLFAAAPDLLAACKKLKAMYAFYASTRTEKQILQQAEDAILKTHPN